MSETEIFHKPIIPKIKQPSNNVKKPKIKNTQPSVSEKGNKLHYNLTPSEIEVFKTKGINVRRCRTSVNSVQTTFVEVPANSNFKPYQKGHQFSEQDKIKRIQYHTLKTNLNDKNISIKVIKSDGTSKLKPQSHIVSLAKANGLAVPDYLEKKYKNKRRFF